MKTFRALAIFACFFSFSAKAQINYGISTGSHVDYNGHVFCTVDSSFLFGATIIFNADSQHVEGTHMDQGSFLDFPSVSGSTVVNCYVGKNAYAMPAKITTDGCTFLSSSGYVADGSAVDSLMNNIYSTAHTATASEFNKTFLGKGSAQTVLGHDTTTGNGNYTYIDINDATANKSITLMALKGAVFGSGTTRKYTKIDSLGIFCSYYSTGVSTFNSSGRMTSSSSLSAILGGTGQTSYAVGDILYASTTTALSKLAGIARGSAMLSNGVNGIPFYGKVRLDSAVAGILPVANGGTNSTTFTPFVAMSLTKIGNTAFGDSIQFLSHNIVTTSDAVNFNFNSFNASGYGGLTSFGIDEAAELINMQTDGGSNFTFDGINQLANVSTANTQVNQDGAAQTITTLATNGFLINMLRVDKQDFQKDSTISGSTVTLTNNSYLITNIQIKGVTLITLTINLFASPTDGQIIKIANFSSGTIGTLTISGNGHGRDGTTFSPTLNSSISYMYTLSDDSYHLIGN